MKTDPWLALQAAHAAAYKAEQQAFEALNDTAVQGSRAERIAAWCSAQQATAEAWSALHEHACRVA